MDPDREQDRVALDPVNTMRHYDDMWSRKLALKERFDDQSPVSDLTGAHRTGRALNKPLILPYEDNLPQIAEPPLCGPGVALIGRLKLGAGAVLGPRVLIRADGHDISIGDQFSLGEGGTVHIAHEVWPTVIGDRVSAGAGVVIHACVVGNDCVLGDGSIILDGSEIGEGVILEPGSVVFPGSKLAKGQRYGGKPAVLLCSVGPEDVRARSQALRDVTVTATRGADGAGRFDHDFPENFVASTAEVSENVMVGSSASIFFSCRVDAGQRQIRIGARSNIQDNCVLLARDQDLLIGEETTLGHNVWLDSCHIGDRCLIGMGAQIGAGCFIEDDTMVAAGSILTPGTRATSGKLWGGVPFRILSELKPRHRDVIATTITHYMTYADAFRQVEAGQ